MYSVALMVQSYNTKKRASTRFVLFLFTCYREWFKQKRLFTKFFIIDILNHGLYSHLVISKRGCADCSDRPMKLPI